MSQKQLIHTLGLQGMAQGRVAVPVRQCGVLQRKAPLGNYSSPAVPWRSQHNTGSPVYERIERVIVERPPQSTLGKIPDESAYHEPSTEVVREMPGRHWSAD